MEFAPAIQLSEEDKLEVLRQLDQFRQWRTLDDKRYCLKCGQLVNGRDIEVVGGTRASDQMRLVCATSGCPAIPMDWVMPTDEVLRRSAQSNGSSAKAWEVTAEPEPSRKVTGSPLRKIAMRLCFLG